MRFGPAQRLRERPRGLRPLRIGWLALQAGVLLAVAAWQRFAHPAQARLLWGDPAGARVAVSVACLLGLNVAGLLGGWLALDALFPASAPSLAPVRTGLHLLLCAGCFLLFYLPVLLVLVYGPAALTGRGTLLAR
jgi:hypothetical protein